ncbi:MAG: squalene--hopene cyclase [Chloroflexi bacterium]|nr:squalene--hopene cyclase [Chloroflexota bacterium]
MSLNTTLPLHIDKQGLERAISRTRDYLLGIQSQAGYWAGELEADVSVAAGLIPLMYFMTGKVDPVKQQKVINYVMSEQQADGSWSAYYGGTGDLSVTVQAYFALKLAGVSAAEPFLQRARAFILSRRGITRANTLTKVWLALFGQLDWRGIPSLPPEIILLPDWSYFNIYEFASWSRATIVALMVVLTRRPTCNVPAHAQLSELYVTPESERDRYPSEAGKVFSWRSFFLLLDRCFKAWEKLPFQPGRWLALRRVERWLVDHQEADGSWGGIMLPWVYSLIALKCLGYTLEHPVIARGLQGLASFTVEDESTLWLQPATSPVWDTAWATIALGESGLPPDHPALVRAARWLLQEEIQTGGDWQVKKPGTKPGCWAFEFENDLYPDIDDTAVVPRALRKVRLPPPDEVRKAGAIERGMQWVTSMQSRNGGWAAFDCDNNKQILAHIPFADFMTPLDPTSPDVTAHAIELLGGEQGAGASSTGPGQASSLKRAITYLKGCQEADGAWYGRWGVNYIYGTGLVLAALPVAGEDTRQSYVRRAVSWLEACQNDDGGWGETCHTYEDPACRGKGPSTASQTAWALLGLIAAGEHAGDAVRRGINYLIGTQKEEGTWQEEAYTGTGFPRAFYLRYDLYRTYFPLLSLARYKAALEVPSNENCGC